MSIYNLEEGLSLTDIELHTQDDIMAPLPYPLRRKTTISILKQFVIIIRIMLAEYRRTWAMNVFMGFLVPFGFIFFLKSFSGTITYSHAIFLLGGNMATSIALGPMSFLIIKMGWARQSQEFDYWIALPLPKLALVFAIITVALLFALPGLVSIYIFGSIFLGLAFTNFLPLIPLIPLSILPLAGLGALIGIQAPSGQAASMFSNFLIIFIGFLSPMMIPSDALPLPLRLISRIIPTTYVADAFRAVLAGQLNANFRLDILILAAFAVVFLLITYICLDWRASS
jgi:ABC-2 type transport system permease protein